MPNPSLNSFISSNYFNTETPVTPLYAAMLSGSSYAPPTFTGVSGAASTDPGGLFGWLIYARTEKTTPAKGVTTDSYIVYNNASDFVGDLNNLGGITACLLTTTQEQGGTYGFFKANGTKLTGLTNSIPLMHAITYLAYGGTLIIAGTTLGLNNYETNTSIPIDVLIGYNGNTAEVSYVEKTPQVIGIFPSQNNGLGFTAINYDKLFTSSTYVNGNTVADRIFNVNGNNIRTILTSTLLANSTYLSNISMVSDVAGAFVRAKNNNSLYFSIAGSNNSSVVNGAASSPILWQDVDTKNVYKKNRVNFYTISNQQTFLGLDIVGATSGTNSTYTSDERVGPSKLRQDIETSVKNILLKYVYQTNDKSTRSAVTSDVSLYLYNIGKNLDPAYTQIFCDESNNTDYSSTINVRIVVKPLITSEEFNIVVSTNP